MDIMYSPVKNINTAVRMGINKKKHIIKVYDILNLY